MEGHASSWPKKKGRDGARPSRDWILRSSRRITNTASHHDEKNIISFNPLLLKNPLKQAKIAAVGSALGHVNNHQKVEHVNVSVRTAVEGTRRFTAIGRLAVGHVTMRKLTGSGRLIAQNDVNHLKYVKKINDIVSAGGAARIEAVLGIDVTA